MILIAFNKGSQLYEKSRYHGSSKENKIRKKQRKKEILFRKNIILRKSILNVIREDISRIGYKNRMLEKVHRGIKKKC